MLKLDPKMPIARLIALATGRRRCHDCYSALVVSGSRCERCRPIHAARQRMCWCGEPFYQHYRQLMFDNKFGAGACLKPGCECRCFIPREKRCQQSSEKGSK